MIKCFNSKMCGLALILALIVGCSAQIHYDNRTVSSSAEGLAAQVAAAESDVESLTEELKDARISRDIVAKVAETASTWDSPMQKLERANTEVEWAAERLTFAKEWLAKVKAVQNVRQSDSVGTGTSKAVQTENGSVSQ